MGTSSARRAPTTWLWRRAKGAASRYLAPAGAGGLEAREVVGRYLAALEETAAPGGQDLLAAFRLTRKAAQTLGAWAAQAGSPGGDAALAAWGLTAGPGQSSEEAFPALARMLLKLDSSLEGAVARSSLAAVLMDFDRQGLSRPARLVAQFLAESIYQRLVLDLGESLEAAGLNFGHWRRGLDGLQGWIAGAAQEEPEAPATPEHWRGLAGWQWVTLTLGNMLRRLRE
jgi:hypothetical protein